MYSKPLFAHVELNTNPNSVHSFEEQYQLGGIYKVNAVANDNRFTSSEGAPRSSSRTFPGKNIWCRTVLQTVKPRKYALDESRAHGFLGQSCFKYILHCYDKSTFSHPHNDAGYPLCKYAVRSGVRHHRCAPATTKHAVARTSCLTTRAIYGTARRRGKFPRA